MNAKPESRAYPNVSQTKLLAFVRAMIGSSRGREDDEHPLPPGPWDPVIRAALESVHLVAQRSRHLNPGQWVFGPRPEPWRVVLAGLMAGHPEIHEAVGGGRRSAGDVERDPQPLPPRYAFLIAATQALVARAELLLEVANAASRAGEQQGIIIVGGYVNRFSDDFCGTDFRLRWPFPSPRPHWFTAELDAIDLVVMATGLEDAAKESYAADLRRSLAGASSRFAEAGLARLQ